MKKAWKTRFDRAENGRGERVRGGLTLFLLPSVPFIPLQIGAGPVPQVQVLLGFEGRRAQLRWRYAQATYRHHFFGHDGFRAELQHSIYLHGTALSRSRGVLGRHHPLSVKIDASMGLCFAEQLDWTMDDFPTSVRELAYEWLKIGP